MRRSLRASIAGSLACGVLVTSALTYGVGLASAEPATPEGIAGLVAAVANADQKLQELGENIQAEQEGVNKAIVDVQTARDNAVAAQGEVDASQVALKDATAAISSAQGRFDTFAASAYMNGPSASYVTAKDPADILETAATGETLNVSTQQAISDLQRARTEQVNRDSAARLAKQKADQSVVDAQSSQDAAVASLVQVQQTFKDQQAQLDQLTTERSAAQAKLAAAREWSAPVVNGAAKTVPVAAIASSPSNPSTTANPATNWDRDPAAAAPGNSKWDIGWDPTLPAIPSAFVSGDPIAILNSVLGMATTSAQATQQMGRGFLQKLGIIPTPTGYTNGAIPRVYGRQASEYVIQRAGAQLGVPYSWGGGNAVGPSRGIDSGAGTTGFDCSGLILYGFAGVGIKLPHYSGAQYDMGRKIPSSQMRRGDVIFYGPGGSQHVTLYLGNGQMLEAPYTGSTVKVSPVRTSGMTPYVIRYIEY
jgi:cell wall-associated NlpC family hydrolase